MNKLILTLAFAFGFGICAQAQIYIDNDGNVYDYSKQTINKNTVSIGKATKENTESKGFDKTKLSFGGNFGLQFGDYTLVNISPQVGYDVSKYFTFGAGLGYTYFKDKLGHSGNRINHSGSYLSFDVFGRFYPVNGLVLSAQPEVSRMWRTIDYGSESVSESKFVPSLLVGGGIRLGGMIAMIQYDVVQNDDSPYGDTFFYTVGYTFGF